MNSLRWTLCLFVLSMLPELCRADDSTQSPVVYTLEIDGRTVTLSPDKPTKVDGNFSSPTVTLRVAKSRTLQGGGITFDYPAYFTYEADTSDPDVQTWTATGNDVTLMLFSFTEEVDPRTLAESTSEALQAEGLKIDPVTVKLGDGERAGVKATMKLKGQSVIQQVLSLPPSSKGSRLLVVQEVRGDGASEAAELGGTLKMVASTMKVSRQ